MKSKNIWFKLLVIFLSISILIPNLSGYKSFATAAGKETVDNGTLSVPPEPLLPSSPTPPNVYEAPEVEYEPTIDQSYADDIVSTLVKPQTSKDSVDRIKGKYAKLAISMNSKAKATSVLEPVAFTKEQIKGLLEQGATIEDIYELAYLSSEQQLDPFELYQRKVKSKGSWDELRQSLTNDKSKSSVTDEVYIVDPAELGMDTLNLMNSVPNVTQSVYFEKDSALLLELLCLH